MEPTLHCARPQAGCEGARMDRVAARPYDGRNPSRGDIVVFRTPRAAAERCGAGGTYIKRVVGMPGDRWSERSGAILIDGRPLREPYIRASRRDDASYDGGTIPPDRYLLLGDNRVASCDSRIWGFVPRKDLLGRVTEIKRGSVRIHIR
jgi:signal peptidase I